MVSPFGATAVTHTIAHAVYPARGRPFTFRLIQDSTLVTVSFLCVDIRVVVI
jgi:hypothetical protein